MALGRAKAANWLLPSRGQRTSTAGLDVAWVFHNAGHHCLKSLRGMTRFRFHTFPCEMRQAMLEDGLQGWEGHGRATVRLFVVVHGSATVLHDATCLNAKLGYC